MTVVQVKGKHEETAGKRCFFSIRAVFVSCETQAVFARRLKYCACCCTASWHRRANNSLLVAHTGKSERKPASVRRQAPLGRGQFVIPRYGRAQCLSSSPSCLNVSVMKECSAIPRRCQRDKLRHTHVEARNDLGACFPSRMRRTVSCGCVGCVPRSTFCASRCSP